MPSTKRKAASTVNREALLQAIEEIEKEKGIDRETMFLAVEAALVSAYRKNHSVVFNVEAKVDRKTAEITFSRYYDVVETVEDPELQMTVDQAKKYSKNPAAGDKTTTEILPFDVDEFGRIAAQTARQVLVQRIREAERDLLYEEYRSREGEVVTVIVQKIIGDKVILNLDKVEAIMPSKEQIQKETYNVGDRLKVYVVRVRKGLRGPLIIVSRTHPKLVEKLFKMEIPEVFDGLIEIKAIVREAGVRTKIAVKSNDTNVDPIGACVGVRGSRIRLILKEVPGEKIDIVPWNEDIAIFCKNALSPAQVTKVTLQLDGHTMQVVVPDNQLSLAIGKQGQNARLAARLTQKRIDIHSESAYTEIASKAAKEAAAKLFVSAEDLQQELQKIPGVGPKAAKALTEAGFSLQKLQDAKPEDLLEVEGVGSKKADKLIEGAKKAYQQMMEEKTAEKTAEKPKTGDDERQKRPKTQKLVEVEAEAKEKEIAEKHPPMTFEEALKLFSKRLGEPKKSEGGGKEDSEKRDEDEDEP